MSNGSVSSAIEIDIVDHDDEIASLARMLAFARNTANDLGLDSTVYCLTMTLQSIFQHLKTEDPASFPLNDDFQLVTSRH